MKIEVNVWKSDYGHYHLTEADSKSDAELQVLKHFWKCIGTSTIEVAPPMKEVVKEVAVSPSAMILSNDEEGMKFVCGLTEPIVYIPIDAYDIKLTYKVKEPV